MITAEELKAQIQSQPRQYMDADLQQLTEAENHLKTAGMDFTTTEGATKNATLVGEYFQQNRNIPVTVQTIIQFVNQNSIRFAWRSRAQQKFDQVVATEGVERGQQMLNYLAGQRSLINSGDQLFENAAELLQELHARAINPESVVAAIGRISAPTSRFDTRRRGKVHFAQAPARKLSEAAQQDDPARKPGQMFSQSEMNNSPASFHHNHALDTEQTPATPVTVTSAAKHDAESIQGNSHAETAQLQKLFVTKPGTSEIDWSSTLTARRSMQEKLQPQ